MKYQDVEKASQLFWGSLNLVAPIKKFRIKQRSEQWANDDISKTVRLRNASYADFRKSKKNKQGFLNLDV